MARMHLLAVAAVGFLFSGCVSLEKYNALKLQAEENASRCAAAESARQAAEADARAKNELAQDLLRNRDNPTALLDTYAKQIALLTADNNDLKAKYEAALRGGGGTIALPPGLSDELRALAAANSDVMDFDAARGIVKFKSDVTFALGSAKIEDKAAAVIDRFAQILTSSTASGYELMVAGHTDSAPVVRAETKAEGHKDNWYLSAHRAISVAERLISHGIAQKRLAVSGYADTRPISTTAAANRRVEVMILPTKAGGIAGPTRPVGAPKINKDTGPVAPPAPKINK